MIEADGWVTVYSSAPVEQRRLHTWHDDLVREQLRFVVQNTGLRDEILRRVSATRRRLLIRNPGPCRWHIGDCPATCEGRR